MDGKEILAIVAILVLVSVWYFNQAPSTATPTTTTTAMITSTTSMVTTTTAQVTTTTASTTTTTASFAILSAEATPNPVKINKKLNFSAVVAEPKSDFVRLRFCKETTCSQSYCTNIDYASPAGKTISCEYIPTVVIIGTNQFWVKAEKAGAQTGLYGPFNFTVIPS